MTPAGPAQGRASSGARWAETLFPFDMCPVGDLPAPEPDTDYALPILITPEEP